MVPDCRSDCLCYYTHAHACMHIITDAVTAAVGHITHHTSTRTHSCLPMQVSKIFHIYVTMI